MIKIFVFILTMIMGITFYTSDINNKNLQMNLSQSLKNVAKPTNVFLLPQNSNESYSSSITTKPSEISYDSAKEQENRTSKETSNEVKAEVFQLPDKFAPNTPLPLVKPVLDDSFENGLGKEWIRLMANDTYSGAASAKYAREGARSYRIELRKTDPIVNKGKRSEIITYKPASVAGEYIYNFSILLPKDGSEDYALDPKGGEIIAQWHNMPDPGEEWTYPPLALRTRGDGHYVLERYWDEEPMSTVQKMNAEGKKACYDLGPYLDDKGKWVDWTFHIKWGWLASQYPIIEIYKNYAKIFELKDEPNTTNDKEGVRLQIGMYKWEWGHTEESILTNRVIYLDDISIKQIIW